MGTERFFDETREQSIVKAKIVEKYFDAWASIITATQDRYRHDKRIGYVDLFAGPGRYKDGSISTPIRILQKAISNENYAHRLITIFNDKDEGNTRSLQEAISQLPGIDTLKFKPEVWNEEVGDKIAADFEKLDKIPVLVFIDPWGYKGLSLRLVDAFLKDWGCDCVFFFNYSRINAGLNNPFVREHMAALFGEVRAEKLGIELSLMPPAERESTIVNELAAALKSFGYRFVLPFCFKNESGKRTTHHLIFVTKHFKGYEVMKEIMAKASSKLYQGVPDFTYSPAASRKQLLLFEFNRPLDDLEQMLLDQYSGQTLSMVEIYMDHSIGRPYLKKHYKNVLAKMEDDGKIMTEGRRSQRGFSDRIKVIFPQKET